MKRQHAAILLALKPGRFRKCCRECPALLTKSGRVLDTDILLQPLWYFGGMTFFTF